MKTIDVPLHLQADGSMDCGPVCVQMVLESFGIPVELDTLVSRLEYGESGTSAYDNGVLLLSAGLKVTAITAQPLLFSPDTIPLIKTREDLVKVIDTRIENVPSDKPILDTLTRFLEEGGEMSLEIPAFTHIKETIDASGLIIALLYGKALGSKEGGYHFVVVNGYDDERVHVTNPSPTSKKQGWFPVSDFLYAVHASTTKEVDNGTLLAIFESK